MEIELKRSQDEPVRKVRVQPGMTLEDVYRQYAADLPLKVILGKVDHRYRDLTFSLSEPCRVELLDIRTQAAKMVYQHSLILVYLKAVEDVIGRVPVEIQNSLRKGLYTEIRTEQPVTDRQVTQIEARMHELIDANLPLKKVKVEREEGLRVLDAADLKEKKRLLEAARDVRFLKLYSLEGFVNFFYGLMVPSTGYLYDFSLQKYMKGLMLLHPHQGSPGKATQFYDDRNLYRAFEETKKWYATQDIHYVMDLNEKIDRGESREMIQLSEALHEKKIVEIAADIMKKKKRIILIAGPSSSGKTTFARRLCVQLQVEGARPLYLGTDDYFVERDQTPLDQNGERDYENLDAVDIDLFNRQMNELLSGKTVDLPSFDFLTGKKVFGKRITSIQADQPIVIEGIHALNDQLTPYIGEKEKYRIYISPLTSLNIDRHNRISMTDMRLIRRIVRDYRYRGHSAADTIRSWPKVRAGEDRNVFPYNGRADVFFNSSHVYELGVLKKYAVPLLKEITQAQEEYGEALRIRRFLDFFQVIENGELISNNSILREFIGGSVFVE